MEVSGVRCQAEAVLNTESCDIGFAVKFKIIHLQRGQIIGRASAEYTLPYL